MSSATNSSLVFGAVGLSCCASSLAFSSSLSFSFFRICSGVSSLSCSSSDEDSLSEALAGALSSRFFFDFDEFEIDSLLFWNDCVDFDGGS